MKTKVFTTRRLVLRALRPRDHAAWYRAHVHGGAKRNEWDHGSYRPEECTSKIFKRMLLRQQGLRRQDKYYRFSAFLKKDGSLVGHVDFAIYERGSLDFANLGYMLHSPHWGKGLAQEMVKKGLTIGHQVLKLHRLEASIDLANRRSQKLCRRLGLFREGIKRRYWYQDRRWCDQVIYVSIK